MCLQSSVRILDTLYSSYGRNPRFVYWTLFTLRVAAIPGSYIQWRNVALSLSGSNYDRDRIARYLWPQPSPAPTYIGRAIAQAVSHRLPTAAARVPAQVWSCGICGGQSGTGASFLLVLRFPLPILIPPTAPQSSSTIRGWYNRPISGRRTKWSQSHPTPRKKKTTVLLYTHGRFYESSPFA
jgi:hypothetical protein